MHNISTVKVRSYFSDVSIVQLWLGLGLGLGVRVRYFQNNAPSEKRHVGKALRSLLQISIISQYIALVNILSMSLTISPITLLLLFLIMLSFHCCNT